MEEQKQQQQQKLSAEARKVLHDFSNLNDADKIQVLNRAGIWYLKYKGALVAPMPEVREILQLLARLSWLLHRVFTLGQKRKIEFDVKLLEIISENTIQDKVVIPATNAINKHIECIEELIINAKKKMEENNA